MSIMEIVLLAAGGIVFLLSFMIPAKKEESSEEARALAKDEIKTLVSEELEAVRGHVDDVVEEAVTYSIEKTERSLERLSNEKIMAVNEYSDTVLAEIHKNHEEVMFLYDMLNDKHTNLKNTVSEINRTVKEAKETKKEAEEVVNTFQRLAPETVSPLKVNGMSTPQTAASQQVFATAPHAAMPANVVQQRAVAQQKINTQHMADRSQDLHAPQGMDVRQRVNMPHTAVASQMTDAASRAAVPAAPQFMTVPRGSVTAQRAVTEATDMTAQKRVGVQDTAAALSSGIQRFPVTGQELVTVSSDTAPQLSSGEQETIVPVPDPLSQIPVMGQEVTVPAPDTISQLPDMAQEAAVSGSDTMPHVLAAGSEVTVPESDAMLQSSAVGQEVTAPVSGALPHVPAVEQEVTAPVSGALPHVPAVGQEAAVPGSDALPHVSATGQEITVPGQDAVRQTPLMVQEIPVPAAPQVQVPAQAQEGVAGVHAVMQGEAVPPVFATAPISGVGQVPVTTQPVSGVGQVSVTAQPVSEVGQVPVTAQPVSGVGQMPVTTQPVSAVPHTVTAPQQEYAVPPVFATAPVPMTAQMPVTQQPYAAQQSFAEPIPGGGSPLPSGSISFTQETDGQGRNYNDRILEMYKEGKSKVVIAKELNLGVGEVKLVIDLYKNRSERVK